MHFALIPRTSNLHPKFTHAPTPPSNNHPSRPPPRSGDIAHRHPLLLCLFSSSSAHSGWPVSPSCLANSQIAPSSPATRRSLLSPAMPLRSPKAVQMAQRTVQASASARRKAQVCQHTIMQSQLASRRFLSTFPSQFGINLCRSNIFPL